MDEQTTYLLKECTSGCKRGIDSIDLIMEYVEDEKLGELLKAYQDKHEELEKEAASLLAKSGKTEKEPGTISMVMARFTTEMKLMVKNDSKKIAKLMLDGCNMGIQSICKVINENPKANSEAIRIAKKIVTVEENFVKEMEKFL